MRSMIEAGTQRSRWTNSFCAQYVRLTAATSRRASARSISSATATAVIVAWLTRALLSIAHFDRALRRFYTTLCYTQARSSAPRRSERAVRARRPSVGSVRVAIIGVGNCASSLVQGVHYYRQAPDDGFIPGLMHPRLAGYHVGDIEFSAAFDIDARKVGKDLAEAIFEAPNNTVKFAA